MRTLPAAVALLLVLISPALGDDLVGQYRVEGTGPGGGGGYSGTVTVEQTGQTYRVVWQIGSTRYIGTALGGPQGIAATYRSGNDTGVAIYTPARAGVYEGFWTYAGGDKIGTERWTKR